MTYVNQIVSCLSCDSALATSREHTEIYLSTLATEYMPLCDVCVDNPARMDMAAVIENIYSLRISEMERKPLMLAMMKNRLERYLSLVGVVVCILVMETGEDYFDVMLVNRKDQPEGANSLSLIAGFMEQKHKSGPGTAVAESDEEANVLLDPEGPIYPFDWSTNPRNTLTLNCVVVHPEAVLAIRDFEEDNEVTARQVFRVKKDILPDLCIPIHNTFLKRLHDERFLGVKPPYVWW
jgi:hypothetical protein